MDHGEWYEMLNSVLDTIIDETERGNIPISKSKCSTMVLVVRMLLSIFATQAKVEEKEAVVAGEPVVCKPQTLVVGKCNCTQRHDGDCCPLSMPTFVEGEYEEPEKEEENVKKEFKPEGNFRRRCRNCGVQWNEGDNDYCRCTYGGFEYMCNFCNLKVDIGVSHYCIHSQGGRSSIDEEPAVEVARPVEPAVELTIEPTVEPTVEPAKPTVKVTGKVAGCRVKCRQVYDGKPDPMCKCDVRGFFILPFEEKMRRCEIYLRQFKYFWDDPTGLLVMISHRMREGSVAFCDLPLAMREGFIGILDSYYPTWTSNPIFDELNGEHNGEPSCVQASAQPKPEEPKAVEPKAVEPKFDNVKQEELTYTELLSMKREYLTTFLLGYYGNDPIMIKHARALRDHKYTLDDVHIFSIDSMFEKAKF